MSKEAEVQKASVLEKEKRECLVGECKNTMYLEHIFRLDKSKSFVSRLEIVESLTHVALTN